MTNIDITKTYQTRDGREVVIFEVSDKVYCKIRGRDDGEWCVAWRHLTGKAFGVSSCAGDLIPAKQWRAWKSSGEGPKVLMIRWKNLTKDTCDVVYRRAAQDSSDFFLFVNADWLHEDGTTTPCGVCE